MSRLDVMFTSRDLAEEMMQHDEDNTESIGKYPYFFLNNPSVCWPPQETDTADHEPPSLRTTI